MQLAISGRAADHSQKQQYYTRLESKTVRAIDVHEGATIDEAALTELLLEAVGLNTSNVRERFAPDRGEKKE